MLYFDGNDDWNYTTRKYEFISDCYILFSIIVNEYGIIKT